MHVDIEKRNLLSIYLASATTTTDLDSPFVHNLTRYHLVLNVMNRQRSEGKLKLSGDSRSVCQIMHLVKVVQTFRNFHLPLCKPLLCRSL